MSITLFPTNYPPQSMPVIDQQGRIIAQAGAPFFQALWSRTGGGTGIVNDVNSNTLTAEGTTQADALALLNDWNLISVTPLNSGVIFPSLTGGQSILIINYGSNNLKIYPKVGCFIDALAVNSPYVLAPQKMQIFFFTSSSNAYSGQWG